MMAASIADRGRALDRGSLPKISAIVIAVATAFAILAFAGTERWAITVFEVTVFALAAGWGLRMIVAPLPLRGTWLAVPLGAATLWGFVQLAAGVTVYRFATWSAVWNWAAYLALFLISVQVFTDSDLRGKFLAGALYFGFALSIVSVLQYFTAEGKIYWLFATHSGNSFGPFVNRDHYAALIELLLPLSIFAGLADDRRTWLHAAIAGAMFASVIAGASRAGAILITLEAAVLFLFAMVTEARQRNSSSSAAARVIVFVALYSAVVGWGVLLRRFQDPDPFKFRREMTVSAIHMAEDRPWFGSGLGTFETAYPAYAVFDNGLRVDHAHNDWAEWAAEGGVPFLIMLLATAFLGTQAALRHPWGLGVVFVLIHCLVDFPMQIPGVAVPFFVLLGALAAAESAPRRRTTLPSRG